MPRRNSASANYGRPVSCKLAEQLGGIALVSYDAMYANESA